MVPGDLCIPVLRIWLLLPGSGWQQGCAQDTLTHTHTHRGLWSGWWFRLLHTHTEQHGLHNPSLMLPKLREGHKALFSSSPPGNQNAGSLVKKMCALILHIQKHTQACTVPLNVSMASKPVKYPCLEVLAVQLVYNSLSSCQKGQCDVWVLQMWKCFFQLTS